MTWPAPVEITSQLKKSGSVTLDGNGNGVITFDPDSGRQRWEVSEIVVSTNQNASATVVPVAQAALNSVTVATMSQGNNRGASWSGNQDTFTGKVDVGPCDFLSVVFSAPAGQAGAGAALSGVIAYAVVTGTKFTRRM